MRKLHSCPNRAPTPAMRAHGCAGSLALTCRLRVSFKMVGAEGSSTTAALSRESRTTVRHPTRLADIAPENYLLVLKMQHELVALGNATLAAADFLSVLSNFAMEVAEVPATIDTLPCGIPLAARKSAQKPFSDFACLCNRRFHKTKFCHISGKPSKCCLFDQNVFEPRSGEDRDLLGNPAASDRGIPHRYEWRSITY